MLRRFILLLVFASAVEGCSSSDANQCQYLDVHGAKAGERSFKHPIQDAVSVFQERGLTFAVVRNSYGNTVAPLSSEIEPYEKLEIQYQHENALGDRLVEAAIERSKGRYGMAPLQEDVMSRTPDGKWQINFMDVERPCIHAPARDYAKAFNTQMLRLALPDSDLWKGS